MKSMRIYIRRLGSAALPILFSCGFAMSQEFRGSITGKITDPNGAVVPGATVSIKNVETNAETTATTNDEGSYDFPVLLPGKYRLVVTREGFKVEAREQIEVRVADKLTIDVQLQTGSIAETVTVISTATLETGSVTTGAVIERKQIAELPLSEGTAYQLATLAPGVVYTGNPQFTAPISNGNLAAFRVNGAPAQNQITLDGSPNYAFDFAVGFSPPADAVQEFKIQTNVFDAQQGYSAGGTVNVAVKSGTNNPHGSIYYFNRDRSRTANNFFSNRSGQGRPIRTYHRFGGVVSGPVDLPKIYHGRDKTFFLFSYERLLDNTAEPQLFSVPTAAMRNGDFSALITDRTNVANTANTIIYNPLTGATSGSNVVRTSFGCPTSGAVPATCNIIPSTLFSPIAGSLLKYYPLPNMVFDMRVSFNKFTQERHPGVSIDPTTLGFTAQAAAAFRGYQYFPMIEIRNLDAVRPIRADLGSMRSDWNAGRLRPFMMGSIQPTVTRTFGNHTAKVGWDFRVVRENFISNGYQGGRLFFDGTYTSPASNSSTTLRNAFGRDIAAFLLGIATAGSGSTASKIDNAINYSVQSVYNGFFFHDDWRVTAKLTLNLGLRYELEGGLSERFNRIQRGFDLATG